VALLGRPCEPNGQAAIVGRPSSGTKEWFKQESPSMILNFSKDMKVVLMNTAVAAGQGTTNTAIFDMGEAGGGNPISGGFDAIAILVVLNTVVATATVTVRLQDNSLNQAGGMATVTAAYASVATQNASNATVAQDSTNAGLVATDVGGLLSNSVLVLDVTLPQLRYVRAQIVTAVANVTIGGVVGILYRTKAKPVTLDATNVITGLFVASS
jgi:hypothetical protein